MRVDWLTAARALQLRARSAGWHWVGELGTISGAKITEQMRVTGVTRKSALCHLLLGPRDWHRWAGRGRQGWWSFINVNQLVVSLALKASRPFSQDRWREEIFPCACLQSNAYVTHQLCKITTVFHQPRSLTPVFRENMLDQKNVIAHSERHNCASSDFSSVRLSLLILSEDCLNYSS